MAELTRTSIASTSGRTRLEHPVRRGTTAAVGLYCRAYCPSREDVRLALPPIELFARLEKAIGRVEKASKIRTNFGMAGSRTHARGFQPIPSVTEKRYPVTFFRRTVPEPSLPVPTVSDPSVTKCDTAEVLRA
jgi:hypothetical protein